MEEQEIFTVEQLLASLENFQKRNVYVDGRPMVGYELDYDGNLNLYSDS